MHPSSHARQPSGAALILLLSMCMLGLNGCGPGAVPPPERPSATATATAVPPTATASAPATPPPDLAVAVLPDIAHLLKPLHEFTTSYGEPPSASSGRIRIPRIGVDAPIGERKAPSNLDLSGIYLLGPSDVIWYDFAASPGYGGQPGAGGNAILSAHVDYNYAVHWAGEAYYRGPGVFAGLGRLEPNDGIEVTFRGVTSRFSVVWKREVPDASDWAAIYTSEIPEGDSITLISCSGGFNAATQQYDSRTIIRARQWKAQLAANPG